MNEVSKTINFVIERFNLDSLVHTITMSEDYDLDSSKENIYPLVNLNYKESDPRIDVVVSYFDIVVMQQRNIEPVKTDAKLMFDTNMIDNLNETHSIANKFIQYLELQNNSLNVEIDSRSRLVAFKDKAPNGCDGYRFSIALSIPNKTSGC